MRYITLLLFGVLFSATLHAQMWIPELQDTLYGNEWIDFEHADRYYKIEIQEDGFYKIPKSSLPNAGSGISASNFQIFYMGNEIPLYTTTNGVLGDSDYLLFYGKRNRGDLDQFLFLPGNQMLNPEYSLFTDVSTYFLTWSDSENGLRFTDTENNLSNPPTPEPHFRYKEIVYETERHNKMKQKAGTVSLEKSFFDNGEGFGKYLTSSSNGGYEHTFMLSGIVNQGEDPLLNLRYAGANNVSHLQTISLNGEVVLTDEFNNYGFRNLDIEPFSVLSENSDLEINLIPAESAANTLVLGTASIEYTRNFDFDGLDVLEFNLEASNQDKYLEIENFNTSGDITLFDLTNNLRIEAQIENGLVRLLIPPSAEERNLVLVNELNNLTNINNLTQIEFINFFDDNSEFIILSHPAIYLDDQGINRVQEYADYRSNEYITEVIDIAQLYDQFAYGVQFSPISIRNFAHFTKEYNENAKFFFLLGNAREYNEVRDNASPETAFYVPTFGKPGSDNLLFGSFDKAEPIFSLGRLTAQSAGNVKDYLDKVREMEDAFTNSQTLEDRLWMKNILHLGGGGSDSEQAGIRSNLEGMADILENSMYGAIPNGFYKTSTDVIDESPREAIENLVNNGISILNFFGHSSPNGFDFPIQDPSAYSNQGRYFFMISNGCFSGRCHREANGIGENFLFEPNKGAIAYIASNGYGYISALNTSTRNFYNKLGNTMYGLTLGEIFRAVTIEAAAGENPYNGINLLSQQNTFQGDPAIRLYPHEGSDITFDEASTSSSPTLINTQLDNFTFSVDMVNLGKYFLDTLYLEDDQYELIPDTINVELRLQYPNGITGYTTSQRITIPPARKRLEFTIPISDTEDIIGLNTVFIKLDTDNEVEELPASAEFNNELKRSTGELGVEVLVVSNDVIPIFPKKYGITNNQEVQLIASTVDIFAEEQNFIIQIDTTAEFNSPIFQEKIITQSGGLLKWKPSISFEDDVVYYWRTSPEAINGDLRWNTSSFLFLEEAENGWNQSHYFQFVEDSFNFMVIDENRNFNFVEDFKEIRVENGVQYFNGGDVLRPCLFINDAPQHCSTNFFFSQRGVRIFVLDSLTLEPKINPLTTRKFFSWNTDTPEARGSVIEFLQDSIEIGNYVAFLTIQRTENHDFEPEEWAADSDLYGTNIFELLEQEGADLVRQLEDLGSRPYAFFYKKGYPDLIGGESLVEEGEIINSIYSASAAFDRGSVLSPEIGPASNWTNLQWEASEIENSEEAVFVNIYGLNTNGETDTLASQLINQDVDLSGVDSEVYPKLQLEWFSRDSLQRTSPQLVNWRILFSGIPEAALNPQIAYEITADTVQQGQNFNLKIGVENISPYDMDSLLINYIAKDVNNEGVDLSKRSAPLLAQEDMIAEVSINTRELIKNTSLLVDVNPNFDQIEETRINNTGLLNFYVESDRENPIMDVTFDGVHILNGDLVSSEPQIVMSFTDENRFLAMEDTSQFRLHLVYPDRTEKRIYFNQANVLFIPADAQNLGDENKAVVEYAPVLDEDGTYKLKVEGQDASGNQSGELEYSIEFEVITKSMISNVLNYPNPFSTATRFVYTLTGNESPTFFKIQIMTVSGRIVREITQTELGEMKIGTHQTDFIWDGTDEYGDILANGVYLYRVLAKNAAGEDIEQYETDADRFFNQGFGKMVIVR